jgi:hypothetical protein
MNTLLSSSTPRALFIALALGILGGTLVMYPLLGYQQTSTQITINDVYGLANELAIRPTMGVDFLPNSVAYVDSSGVLESVLGPANDCVTVVGFSAPCGNTGASSGSSVNFVDGEVLSGVVNGANKTFFLSHIPNPSTGLHLFRNGVRLNAPGDYVTTGSTGAVVLTTAPGTGDQLIADYRF